MTQYSDITRFFAILSLLFLIGCQSGSVERQRNGDERFKTTAPSFIYFKNIRSLKYQNNRDTRSQMDFYRPKAFTKKNNLPIIYPVIVHNWLEDESYLILEKKNMGDTDKIMVENAVSEITAAKWPEVDYIEQLALVEQLENALKSGKEVSLETVGGEKKSLVYSNLQKTGFITVIQDFRNLTETASSRAKK